LIYCVVPAPLAGELYDKLADYYRDDPNVEVIVDRRGRSKGPGSFDAKAERRRRRAPGSFPPIVPPNPA
jgi:hypothetical protein